MSAQERKEYDALVSKIGLAMGPEAHEELEKRVKEGTLVKELDDIASPFMCDPEMTVEVKTCKNHKECNEAQKENG